MAQVVAQQEKYQALNVHVVAISFGTDYWAKVWLSETNSPYPLLLDQSHESYKVFGLDSSLRQAWGFKNLVYYAKALMRGEKLKENRGDTHQLGGDFVIDQTGIVRLAHPSKEPTDRIDVARVLEVCKR